MSVSTEAPRLSHSKVTRYDSCPRAYQHYYVEGWRPIAKRPPLLFGEAVDRALTALFQRDADPGAVQIARRPADEFALLLCFPKRWQAPQQGG